MVYVAMERTLDPEHSRRIDNFLHTAIFKITISKNIFDKPDCGCVARAIEGLTHSYWTKELIVIVIYWVNLTVTHIYTDRGVGNNICGLMALLECFQINERFERRADLAQAVGSVQVAVFIGFTVVYFPSADNSKNSSVICHHHDCALNLALMLRMALFIFGKSILKSLVGNILDAEIDSRIYVDETFEQVFGTETRSHQLFSNVVYHRRSGSFYVERGEFYLSVHKLSGFLVSYVIIDSHQPQDAVFPGQIHIRNLPLDRVDARQGVLDHSRKQGRFGRIILCEVAYVLSKIMLAGVADTVDAAEINGAGVAGKKLFFCFSFGTVELYKFSFGVYRVV